MFQTDHARAAYLGRDTKDEQVKSVRRTKPIRVLLINMPTLLFDMIKGIIVWIEDMQIVGETITRAGIFRAAAAARADVVILSGEDVSPENYYQVLYRRPRLKIFAISADGRRGSLYELRPRVKAIGDISAESLIAAIRGGTSAGETMARQ
jgi:chemotaxis response regulator CheB